MRRSYLFLIAGLAALWLAGCSQENPDKIASKVITVDNLARHIKVLASDDFGGRAPSSPGEEKTIQYLKTQLRKMGLKPGNGDSYFQEVPLVEITADPAMDLKISGRGKTIHLKYQDDFIGITRRVQEKVEVKNSDLVFVGYGIVAPEYHWNDYAGLDMHGKTAVILVNDPGYATGDSALFHGKAMTYYGRWTYKYEEAARQGAAGAIIIHETGPAGYPWAVVRNSWSGPQSHLETADKNMSRCALEAWITLDKAKALFKKGGLDYQKLTADAAKPGFRPRAMGLRASVRIENKIRHSNSHNVIGLLPGTDRKDEYIIYTAHWDHFGTAPNLKGDQIFNGALDNASGCSAVLNLAETFASLPKRPRRSLVFMFVTAEEQGLLGSEYYTEHPVFPLNKTIANINIDGLDVWGKMKDITIIGFGNSELDDYAEAAAKAQGRTVRPDPEPEKGYFYRSDHFNFAKHGVPALYTDSGINSVAHGEQWTLDKIHEWTEKYYHKPADEYDPSWWDLSGAVDDVKLLFAVGYKLSMEDRYPDWRPGNEFKAIRDADLAKKK